MKMKYFKNKDNEIYAYYDDINLSILEKLIKKLSLISITEGEAESILAPSLEDLKQQKIQKAESFRNSYWNKGVPYQDVVLHGGKESARYIAIFGVARSQQGATSKIWKAKNHKYILNPTINQLQEMLELVYEGVEKGYTIESTIINDILSIEDTEVLKSYDVETRFNELLNESNIT